MRTFKIYHESRPGFVAGEGTKYADGSSKVLCEGYPEIVKNAAETAWYLELIAAFGYKLVWDPEVPSASVTSEATA